MWNLLQLGRHTNAAYGKGKNVKTSLPESS